MICTLLNLSNEILYNFIMNSVSVLEVNICIILFILLIIGFSKLMLHLPLYCHHIIGIILITISVITKSIINSPIK